MEIFTNEVASTLQYFTFPLEVVGLSLATIEVRFPETAKRIAAYANEQWRLGVESPQIPVHSAFDSSGHFGAQREYNLTAGFGQKQTDSILM